MPGVLADRNPHGLTVTSFVHKTRGSYASSRKGLPAAQGSSQYYWKMNLQKDWYARGLVHRVLAAGQFGKLLSEVCEGHNGALHDILPVP